MSGCYIQTPVICDDCSHAPHIGGNGNWYVGDTDTGVRAQGPQGENGKDADISPDGDIHIQSLKGENIGYFILFPTTHVIDKDM